MLTKRPLAELIEELNLPPDSKFLGYVIHRPSSDEFLVKREKRPSSDAYLWTSAGPDTAMRFQNPNQAASLVKKYGKGAVVGGLFETSNEYRFYEL